MQFITQSLTKALETSCPRKVQDEFIDNNKTSSIHKERGSFFETLCLGAGAAGQMTTTLPTLKKGSKSIDQVRIEKQAQRFQNMFDPSHPDFNGRIITDRQIELTHLNKRGTIDFITDGIIWDLKLTATMDGWWSAPEENDLLQQVYYRWLYYQKFGEELETRLLVFEYAPAMRIKEIKVNVTPEATLAMLSRIDRIEETLAEWEALDEWPRIPSETSCSTCPLVCPKRMVKNNIIFQEITI